MPLTIGQTIFHRYQIHSLLGRGGMGAVYRAYDLRLNTAVAVKVMVPPSGLSPVELDQLRKQFRQEAELFPLGGLD